MADEETIPALLDRGRAATGPDTKLDRDIATALNDPWSNDEEGNFGGYDLMPQRVAYTASIDAAVALSGRKLPGWVFDMGNSVYGQHHDRSWCRIYPRNEQHRGTGNQDAATLPLAIVCALLVALSR